MTLPEMIEATKRELAMREKDRQISVERVQELLLRPSSPHLAHHLASSAAAIAEHDGKIDSTRRVLKMLEESL